MHHAGCVSVAGIHLSRTWMSGSLESVRWNAYVQTTPRFILSSSFGGKETEPIWTPREKSPLPEAFSSEDWTHDAASSRTATPAHYQRAILAALICFKFHPDHYWAARKQNQLLWLPTDLVVPSYGQGHWKWYKTKHKISLTAVLYSTTTKLKQKPWKQQQPKLKSAPMFLTVLSSLRMPCPSCRPFSPIGTLATTTYLMPLSILQALQSNRDTDHNNLSDALSILQALQSNRDTDHNDLSDALSILQALQSNRDTDHNDLSDALSILQALQSNRDTDHNDLSAALASLCRSHAVTLQWILSLQCAWQWGHWLCSKEGTTKEQMDRSTCYAEVKTILKAKQHSKWRHKHPRYKTDPYNLLTRPEQVTVFRLRTGHNHHRILNFAAIQSSALAALAVKQNICCSPAPSTSYSEIWPDHTPVACKLDGSLGDLQCTSTFEESGVFIWQTRIISTPRWWDYHSSEWLCVIW